MDWVGLVCATRSALSDRDVCDRSRRDAETVEKGLLYLDLLGRPFVGLQPVTL